MNVITFTRGAGATACLRAPGNVAGNSVKLLHILGLVRGRGGQGLFSTPKYAAHFGLSNILSPQPRNSRTF